MFLLFLCGRRRWERWSKSAEGRVTASRSRGRQKTYVSLNFSVPGEEDTGYAVKVGPGVFRKGGPSARDTFATPTSSPEAQDATPTDTNQLQPPSQQRIQTYKDIPVCLIPRSASSVLVNSLLSSPGLPSPLYAEGEAQPRPDFGPVQARRHGLYRQGVGRSKTGC